MYKKSLFFLVLLLLSSRSVFFAQTATETIVVSKGQKQVKKELVLASSPVVLFNDTLFYIHNKIGAFTPSIRANAISERIKTLYEDPFFSSDSLKIIPSEFSLDIVYKDKVMIMSVINSDAEKENVAPEVLVNRNLTIIKKSIENYKLKYSYSKIIQRIALELLFIGLIVGTIYLVFFLFRRLRAYLIENKRRYFSGFKWRNHTILSETKQLLFAIKSVNLFRNLIVVLIVYLSLPLLFSVFPSTENYASVLLKWILQPVKSVVIGFVNFLPNLVSIFVIVLVFNYIIKILKYFVVEIQKENIKIDGFYSDWAKPTFNIVKFLLFAFMIVIIFPYLPGSDSPIFKGVTVFIGLLFSIGSSNAIANMVAGLVITYMRPFTIGDFIKIGEVCGEVIEKTALVTRIRTTKQEEVTIPNATVLSSNSTNFSANTDASGLIIHSTVTIGYDVPWKKIHEALIEAALRTEKIEKQPKPFVLQMSLDDFYVSYQINAYTKSATKQPIIYSQLHQNIQDCFRESGIEIMSPHYNALRDGNKNTIPES
jgi:small-conductance mechanosensitive channel